MLMRYYFLSPPNGFKKNKFKPVISIFGMPNCADELVPEHHGQCDGGSKRHRLRKRLCRPENAAPPE